MLTLFAVYLAVGLGMLLGMLDNHKGLGYYAHFPGRRVLIWTGVATLLLWPLFAYVIVEDLCREGIRRGRVIRKI